MGQVLRTPECQTHPMPCPICGLEPQVECGESGWTVECEDTRGISVDHMVVVWGDSRRDAIGRWNRALGVKVPG